MNSDKNRKLSGLIFDSSDIEINNLPRVDCHLHTSWTDGESSVRDVYSAAVNNNLSTILFSEHSRKSSTDWFQKFAKEVRELPSTPCKAYVGTEVKVETHEGDIDTNLEIMNYCDFIMASVHRFVDVEGKTIQFSDTDPSQSIDLEYQLTWAALSNPSVDILGHMFGMSYKRFGQTPSDEIIKELISRAASFGVAIEVNSYYHPNPLKMLQWCQEYGARVSFGSNAHSLEKVGEIVRMLQKEIDGA